MNRINPLYIGIILSMIAVVLAVKLDHAKNELKDVKTSYKETLKIATQLTGLKEVYSNKEKTKTSLYRILDLSSLSAAKIQKKSTNTGIIITSESMNKNEMNFLMGKILNAPFKNSITEFLRDKSGNISWLRLGSRAFKRKK